MQRDVRLECDKRKDGLAGKFVSGTNDSGLSDALVKDKRRFNLSR